MFLPQKVVRQWNQRNAEATGPLYLPVEWTTKPDEKHNVDEVIGIVSNRIANTEFVQKCIDEGKKVVLLFNDYQDHRNTIQSEYDAVVIFKHIMQDVCTYVNYRDKASLFALLSEKLDVLQ